MLRLRDVARGGDGRLGHLYFYYCHTNHYYYFRGMRPLGGTASLQVWAFPAGWEGLPALPAKWAAGTPISQVCRLQIRTPETLKFDTLRTIFVQFVHNHTLAGHVGQFRSQWHESWPSRDAACKTPRGSSTAYVSATVMGMQIVYPSVLLRRPSAATCRTLSRGSCNL